MMTMKTFKTMLDCYGSDLSRWPASSADEARDLMGCSAQAREAMASARALDRSLDRFAAPDAPAHLAHNAVAFAFRAGRDQPRRSASLPPRRWFAWPNALSMGGAALAMLTLVFIMVFQPQPHRGVSKFATEMDQFANNTSRELQDTDDMLASLDAAQSDENASDDMLHILFPETEGG